MQILMSLMMLSMVFAMMIIASSSAQRIAEMLNEKTDISNPANPVLEVKDGEIDYKNVNFAYASKADTKVLDNVNVHILRRDGRHNRRHGFVKIFVRPAHTAPLRCNGR